jgi:hypothetical protein
MKNATRRRLKAAQRTQMGRVCRRKESRHDGRISRDTQVLGALQVAARDLTYLTESDIEAAAQAWYKAEAAALPTPARTTKRTRSRRGFATRHRTSDFQAAMALCLIPLVFMVTGGLLLVPGV